MEGWNEIEDDFCSCVLNSGQTNGEVQDRVLWHLCERFVLVCDLKVRAWNSLCEWMRGSEQG